jgi:PTH1 family peptidyl-tRNA hydrolase
VSLLDKLFSQIESETPEVTSDGRIRLVVGLGNPGPEYDGTRHNVGFELVDRLAAERDLKWKRDRKFRSKIASANASLVLTKPLTYMNLSGNAVARLQRFHKLDPDQILVVYDDVDLPIGRIRFRPEGSAGGHNGIKSLIEYLGTKEFPRLKIGIGSAGGRGEMVGHVLGKFSQEEREELEKVLAIAQDGVNCALSAGLDRAMNQFNGRTTNSEEES